MSYTMINSAELREKCARQLLSSVQAASRLSVFLGLDGFVDEIIHVVDKRENAAKYQRLPTIAKLAERVAAAAGQSTNFELVTQRTKLGGNGPIMANALASFGLPLTYLGALGYPTRHPVFDDFAKRADVHTIGAPGLTDALEFDDGKIMLGKTVQLGDVNWANIQARYGREKFAAKFGRADLVGFVNWTMIPYMSDVWEALLKELCPSFQGPRRQIFFDLADPEKRSRQDILRALNLILQFSKYFDVTLGLNEKEAYEIGEVLDLNIQDRSTDGLAAMALQIQQKLPINTLVVHPVAYALAVSRGEVSVVKGPFCAKPLISTGAGDHFNAGFCLGKLLGFDNSLCLYTGVATSGFYVRMAASPSMPDLAKMLQSWPQE
jgi:sugar/nucleoside kinase (ribokinase family)